MEINPAVEEHSKKQSLEEMSKEELVKKCKNLLTIAQKAKQAKDQAAQELTTLKEKLKEKECASQELIANITQQKLNLVTKLEDFKQQNNVLTDKFARAEGKLNEVLRINSELDTENQGYKRQVARLTDENDSLLSQLDSLEKESGELKSRLSDLEERNSCLSTANEVLKSERNSGEVQELQKMLSVSLQEVKKIQSDNAELMTEKEILLKTHEEAKSVVEQLEVENAVLKGDLKARQDEIEKFINATDDLNVELHKNRAVIEKLKQDLTNTNARLSESQIVSSGVASDLQNSNEKLKEKLRLYHSKLVKFAGDVKSLKQDKNALMKEFKDYTNHVVEWKGQLKVFSELFVKEFNKTKKQQDLLSEENRSLKQKIEELQANLNSNVSVSDLENNNKILKEEIENLMKQLEDLKQSSAEENRRNKENFAKISKLATENLESDINDVISGIETLLSTKSAKKELEGEMENLNLQISEKEKTIREVEKQNSDLQLTISELERSAQEFQNLKSEKNDELTKSLKEKESESEQYKVLLQSISTFINKPDCDINNIDDELRQLITSLNNTINDLQNQIQHASETEAQLAEKSSQEIISLADKNKVLEKQLAELQNKNPSNETCVQTDETTDCQDQLSILKRENAELLAEMNEMNQVLKERGEIISKQQAYCDEIVKKVQMFETQAKQTTNSLSLQEETIKNLQAELEKSGNEIVRQKNEEISQLQSEIESLKEKLRNSGDQDTGYAESENLSTSTYSRSEEINRLKDLEGSWEERYGKLRSLAVRLKGKVRELTADILKEQSEKTEFQQKLANSLKTVQTVQVKCDKLEDDLENKKTENKNLLKKLDTATMDISKNKRLLAENEETITKLKSDIEEFKKEKENVEKWKKQVSSKVQTLKKEIEANNVMKKEFEMQIAKLHADLEAKEQELKNEIEMHKQTKALLQESNSECKKQSVLTLEMHDYERSVKELSQKLENKEEAITNLKNQIESQKSTINALREQNNILEERHQTEEIELNNVKADIATHKRKISDLEDVVMQKDEKIHILMSNVEESRRENEELSTELSKVITEHQKASSVLKTEKEFLRSQNLGLEQKLREVQESLKLKEQELDNVQSEYQSYKIRAQSVLRQNQTRDIGLEEKLSQEAENLKVQNARLNEQLDVTK